MAKKAVTAAKAHIKELRESRHVDENGRSKGDRNAGSLSRALRMLSNELYTKPTHFILEMIQNADDNLYAAGIKPTLTLVYRDDGFLWVGCNETGFTKENVSAICEIADSTKKVTGGSQKGYIGEKGIGFKSVFRVSDMVWVSSGAYSFKFDYRNEPLGMIAPLWSDFNATDLLDERTMFCLRIPKPEDRESVRRNMFSLGSELLLFVRKLRHIHVRVVSSETDAVLHDYSLHREDSACGNTCTTTTLSRHDRVPETKAVRESFAVFRYTGKDMPEETKREGIHESELVMAFPSPSDAKTSRKTYNFLPIRDYGLPFLLQADFILTANRQDIVERNLWNEALKKHACSLFVESIKSFNGGNEAFKYAWPRFLIPTSSASGTVMDGFLKDLRAHLQSQPVLQCQRGDFKSPRSLVIVPEKYCDENERPLLDEPGNLGNYVSHRYSNNDMAILGLSVQNSKDFCKLLENVTPNDLHTKTTAWHSRLAAALSEPSVNVKFLQEIELIPVRGGIWVKPAETKVWLPDGGRIPIPDDIECLVVEDEAAGDKSRKRLFEKLGVNKITSSAVSKLIIERHKQPDIAEVSLETLASHAWYIFNTENQVGLQLGFLELAKNDGKGTAPGHNLYMDGSDRRFRMSDYFATKGSCNFIHPIYVNYGDKTLRKKWHTWLQNDIGVATLPRLTESTHARSRISPVFRELIDTKPSAVWLKLLRDHWDHYFSAMKFTPEDLDLGSKLVDCKDKSRKQLKETYVATSKILKDKLAADHASFIDVDDPQNSNWTKLRCIGLHTEPDLQLCITVLRAAREDESVILSDEYMEQSLRTIEDHSRYNSEETCALFSNEPLIRVKDGERLTWLTSSQCRWSAPACLPRFTALDHHFPSLQFFFCETLKIPNSSVMDINLELRKVRGDMNKLDNIRALLLSLSEHLTIDGKKDDHISRTLKNLQKLAIFPVRRSTGETRLASNTDKDADWFIANKPRYQQCFSGKIWILDVDSIDFRTLEPLFQRSGLTGRYLSVRATELPEYNGTAKLCKTLTSQLRSKAKFISLLVPEDRQKLVLEPMKMVSVWSAKDVKCRYYVEIDGVQVYGNDEIGRVVVREEKGQPCLFVPESNVTKTEMPWAFISGSLAIMYDLPESKELDLLSILTLPENDMIKDLLDRKGLWKEDYIPAAPPQQEDEDDEEELPKFPADPDQQETKPPLKKEGRETSEPVSKSGKTQRSKSSTSASAKNSKASGGGSRSSGGRQRSRGAAAEPAETDVPEPPANYDEAEPPAPEEPQDGVLIKAIIDLADNYDIENTTLLATSNAEDETQLNALDLLQTSFVMREPMESSGEIAFQGELFVFRVLQANFDAPDAIWTSTHRNRMTEMDVELDGSTSPITITDIHTVQRLTNYLFNHGVDKAGNWLGEKITYRIDVRTTTKGQDEPFVFTNEQLDLAREWSESQEDVHLIVRVYELGAENTKLCIYVNPLELVLGGKLEIASSTGYYLKPKEE